MNLNIIRVSIYAGNWSLVLAYVRRAESLCFNTITIFSQFKKQQLMLQSSATIESKLAERKAANDEANNADARLKKELRENVLPARATTNAALGLYELYMSNYLAAADAFLKVSSNFKIVI